MVRVVVAQSAAYNVSIETVFVRYLFFSILLCGFLRFNVVNKRLIVLNFSYSFGSFENAF